MHLGQVAYIDTEGTFRPERIRPIAERFGLDPTAVLENVGSPRCHDIQFASRELVLVQQSLPCKGFQE